MSEQDKPQEVTDDVVVSMEYTLKVDGDVLDSTEGGEPLDFLQGHQNIIPGLEKELYGLSEGETKDVKVIAAEAYGEFDADALMDVPRSEFPSTIPLETGTELQVKDKDGEVRYATITEVGAEKVQLDFNHPLAGKELNFEIKVVSLRSPTTEELSHGHVHAEDHQH
jgi:FKBP-type peptidyl-prolyl cis-trans isomerase SlyD